MPVTLDYHTWPGKGPPRVEGAAVAVNVPSSPAKIIVTITARAFVRDHRRSSR
ncbi:MULTISPECIES: hypothetical protein [unclassified Cryobacterium]|uniref:hypothetical protein n=1 Tax=unclassified Cryobacterium TaxID=2649013 RepID=UPI002AB59DC1|nr:MULTISPECIES: hypothetical protein [Cryobacterium]MDY7526336.1 hypothetical protein [Cryobacterium sp. 10C2]MDY7557857.1 hypothetical protein [Cryobacterium sp. 10C3]MEB0003527.1 hypothetical protein [Cryobacterium sp. RTC2.1]MEB0203658.1 hypothetical protein [Cryobacterium sp. 5I3]MEB0288632.1 hypothetical protein [Cryobacterium sp. 10S3]